MKLNRLTVVGATSSTLLAGAVTALLLTGIAQAQSTPAWGPK